MTRLKRHREGRMKSQAEVYGRGWGIDEAEFIGWDDSKWMSAVNGKRSIKKTEGGERERCAEHRSSAGGSSLNGCPKSVPHTHTDAKTGPGITSCWSGDNELRVPWGALVLITHDYSAKTPTASGQRGSTPRLRRSLRTRVCRWVWINQQQNPTVTLQLDHILS